MTQEANGLISYMKIMSRQELGKSENHFLNLGKYHLKKQALKGNVLYNTRTIICLITCERVMVEWVWMSMVLLTSQYKFESRNLNLVVRTALTLPVSTVGRNWKAWTFWPQWWAWTFRTHGSHWTAWTRWWAWTWGMTKQLHLSTIYLADFWYRCRCSFTS